MTLSGGAGVLICDAAERHGLDVSPMPEAAQAKLQALLPFATVTNPVDTTAQALNDMSLLARNLEVMLEEGGYGSLVGFFTTVPNTRTLSGPLRKAITEGCARFSDRLIVMSMIGDPEVVADYEKSGFLVFEDPERAVVAIAALVGFARAFAGDGEAAPAAAKATALPDRALSEVEAKALLREAGVPFLDERLATSAAAAGEAAQALGFPVAMKIVSAAIEHKTEIGGVMLGVADRAAAEAAFDELMRRARTHRPDAAVDGVLVAPMAKGGVEMIAGVVRDPVFGPAVMAGLGGIHVEVLRDVRFALAPFGETEARRLIDGLRGRAILDGVRGAPPCDVDAMARLLARLSAFAAAHADDVETIDLNPVLVRPNGEGAVALDALLVPRKA